MRPRHGFLVLLLVLTVIFAAACGDGGGERIHVTIPEEVVGARITAFEPPSGGLRAGSAAPATIRVQNVGSTDRVFWLGYSVGGPDGLWIDAPPAQVEIPAGGETEKMLSASPVEIPGYHDARASVWREAPESTPATETTGTTNVLDSESLRLDEAERPDVFRVFTEREDFVSLEESRWETAERRLGRGRLIPENVSADDGSLRITLPEGSFDGGEIESRDLLGPGFYAARMKVPDAPTSVTGFILYLPPDFESEIDIQIFNDPSGTILFTTYANGRQTNTKRIQLPFDPTQDFHDYAIQYNGGSVGFYVDGELLQTYETGVPDRLMKLYVNSWFPTWLDGVRPASDRRLEVNWVEWGETESEEQE